MSKQEDAAAQLVAAKETLLKSKNEIVTKIDALTQAAANAGDIDPVLQAAIDDFAPLAKVFDDIVEDVVVETPPTNLPEPTEEA